MSVIFLLTECIIAQSAEEMELSRYYSFYRYDTDHINRDITNLNENLNIFSGCLLHIINFEGIELPILFGSRPPILLTRLDFVQVFFTDDTLREFHVPFEKVPIKFGTIVDQMSLKDWGNLEFRSFETLAIRSRPWSCEANLYIFPPWMHMDVPRRIQVPTGTHNYTTVTTKRFLFRRFQISGLFLSDTILSSTLMRESENFSTTAMIRYASAVFSTQWRFDILVAEPEYDALEAWINGILYYKFELVQPPTSHWEIMHWYVAIHKTFKNSSSLWIPAISLFCHYCKPCEPYASIPLFHFRHHWDAIKHEELFLKIRQLNGLTKSTDLSWKLLGFASPRDKSTFQHLDPFDKESVNKRDLFFGDGEIPSYHSYMEVLISVLLENATYYHSLPDGEKKSLESMYCIQSPQACGCRRGPLGDNLIHPNIIYSNTHLKAQIHFSFFRNRFTFASCGHSEGDLPFNQLFSSYNVFTWIAILATIFLVIPLGSMGAHIASEMLQAKSLNELRLSPLSLLARYIEHSFKYF